MNKYGFLREIDLFPAIEVVHRINTLSEEFILFLKYGLINQDIDARVFMGGSFAKKTLIKQNTNDIDIFVMHESPESISDNIYLVLQEFCRQKELKLEAVHGSRNYYRVYVSENILFEVVPVKKYDSLKNIENVTDLSYFHVEYIRKKLEKKTSLRKEIALAKSFCQAQRVYGAESYIKGFSGYAIECLIIHYGSFVEFLKKVSSSKGQIIIDLEKSYKNKNELLVSMNESKTKSPIILIDPVWNKRNILAALSNETLEKFKNIARQFIKKPNLGYFEKKEISKEELKQIAKKKDAEFVSLSLSTNKQEGDIAGTKMKKFADFISRNFETKYTLLKNEFSYSKSQDSEAYYIVKAKKNLMQKGPPIKMKEQVKIFKKSHKKTIIRKGSIYAIIKPEKSAKNYLQNFLEKNKKIVSKMGISDAKVLF